MYQTKVYVCRHISYFVSMLGALRCIVIPTPDNTHGVKQRVSDLYWEKCLTRLNLYGY